MRRLSESSTNGMDSIYQHIMEHPSSGFCMPKSSLGSSVSQIGRRNMYVATTLSFSGAVYIRSNYFVVLL